MDPFKTMLLHISDNLRDDNLEKLKFLSSSKIGKKKLEGIHAGHQLFETLSESGDIGPDNVGFLSDLLSDIGRRDLVEKLDSFERTEPGTPSDLLDEDEAKLQIAIDFIAEQLGAKWRQYSRKLGLSDARLDHIEDKYPRSLDNKVMELFREWRKLRKKEAKVEELIRALRACNLNLVADRTEQQLKVHSSS